MRYSSLQKYCTLHPGLRESLEARHQITQEQSQMALYHWVERNLRELKVRYTENNAVALAKLSPRLSYPDCWRDSNVFDNRVTNTSKIWILNNGWNSWTEAPDKDALIKGVKEFGPFMDAIVHEVRVSGSHFGGEIAVGLTYYLYSPDLCRLIAEL